MNTDLTLTYLILAQLGILLRQPALLNHRSIQKQLAIRPLDNLLLHCPLTNEPKHLHRLRLSNPMRTIHCLQVHLGIPIAIVHNDNVGHGKIDS